MKIASFNVNSIRARLPNITDWLAAFSPDVVCLQEIKAQDEQFPITEIEAAGYHAAVVGQKSYNGVAILSRTPITTRLRALPGDTEDEQARYVEVETEAGFIVGGLYLPNGNPVPGPKFDYKLAWMDRLIDHAQALLRTEQPFVLCGDYNVIPTDADVYDPRAMAGDALGRPESKDRFYRLLNLGLTDSFRVFDPRPGQFSYWDYQRGAYDKDHGWRIDFILASPQAADRLTGAGIDRSPRAQEKASDHTPVWAEFA
ncbi:MAG: Exodeoxyribonuclease III [Rhodospirillaceae bacterium]|nr:exodeoxyribonuclease III [Rhodospirillaceae bacterium]MBL6771769.1 exodeoxyribonuclease III [Alphaproteobacteria bacterium]OUX69924.1 MAG: exodeoxyribonuclease III [Rhodospirillaceae bacterium TMED140]CAI8408338.1 MAG: Exodeoxyribonuclease III [Rhodospirillaceae bacterium]